MSTPGGPDRAAVLRRAVAPVRLPLTAVGLLLAAVGSFLPWAGYAGFPGKMTLAYPGGARLYTLVLSTAFALQVVRWGGRRSAGLVGMLGLTAVAVQTTIAIAIGGGGLVNVSVGAWLTVLGGIIGIVLFAAGPDEKAPAEWGLPSWAAVVLTTVGVVVALEVIVYALNVDDARQFVALVLFLAAAGLTLARLGVFAGLTAASRRTPRLTLLLIAIAAAVFPFTQNGDAYWLRVAASVGVFAAAAIGLNVVVGLAGLLDLGYVAFFGVGAYVAALFSGAALGPTHGPLPFLLVFFMGAIAAGIFGVLIGAPTLRLRGDYLAIVTLGFGEIFRITVTNTDKLTGGPNGVAAIPNLKFPGFDLGADHALFGIRLPYFANYYWIELLLVVVVMVIFVRLNDSRIGRAWVAIREDETAAAAMGINTISLKLLAFGIGATLSGAAGTVNAHLATQVSPDSYTFLQSVTLLAIVVLGGMGTVPGAVLGATLLVVIPEKLRSFADYRLLLFGFALVLLMRFRPEGIVPSRRRQREFHESAPVGGDALAPPPATVAHT